MPKITIGTDVINFPDNGSDALWSPAIIDFAQKVAGQLISTSNVYNVKPTVVKLNTNLNPSVFTLSATDFPASKVRKFSFSYAIYRETTLEKIVECGTFSGIYNTNTSSWICQDEYFGDKKANGTSYHTFSIVSDKVQLTTEQLPGVQDYDKSTISFSAVTELVSI